MGKVLEESLSNFSDRISDAVKAKKNILVTTHIDCDGITSGSIISKALIRHGAKCTVRTTNEFSENLVDKMQKETRDLHVITDLGGGFGKLLDEKLSDNWLMLDHHEISEDENRKAADDVQKMTDKFVAEIDKISQVKEKDMMDI